MISEAMKNDDFDVIVAGHICLDITPAFFNNTGKKIGEIFIPGKLVNVGRATISTGGPVSNTGIALQKLGIRTKLMGKVGDDFFGDGIISLLKHDNNQEGMIVMEGEQTSYTVVIVPPGVERIFLHNPGANNTFKACDLDYSYISKAKLFHFGYPPLMREIFLHNGSELTEIFRRVNELGVTTSLDMSLPDRSSESGQVNWNEVLKKTLPYVDIFLPSYEEIVYMIAPDEFKKVEEIANSHDILEHFNPGLLPLISEKLLDYGAAIVAIKCGERGFYIRTAGKPRLERIGKAKPADIANWAGREIHEESYFVKNIASATGAGDSSIAGFLASYLNELPVEKAIKYACSAGAQNVMRYDALSGITNWRETKLFVDKNPEKNKWQMPGEYWTYDQENFHWKGMKDMAG